MTSSKWFMEFEREVKALQQSQSGKKKVMVIMTPMVFVTFAIVAMVNGATFVQVSPMLVIAALVTLMVLLLTKKTVTEDKAKGLRENLAQLLRSDSEIEEFDAQMQNPLLELQSGLNGDVIFTKDYIGNSYSFGGWPDWRFARLSDIRAIRYCAMKGKAAFSTDYLIDCLDVNGQKLMGISIEKKERMAEFQKAVAKYVPHAEWL